jgi:hypothetical protein
MPPNSPINEEHSGEGEALAASSSNFMANMAERIDPGTHREVNRMLLRDTVMTFGFLALLWGSYAIVGIVIRPIIVSHTVYALFVGCIGLVTVYNTASLLAMVLNMRRDRLFIYIRDILNLRTVRRSRAGQR